MLSESRRSPVGFAIALTANRPVMDKAMDKKRIFDMLNARMWRGL